MGRVEGGAIYGAPMPLAPVEYVIIEFPSFAACAGTADALQRLISAGTVRIIDLVIVVVDGDGGVTSFEVDDLPEVAPLAALEGESELLTDDDVLELAAVIRPGCTGLFVLFEDLWAAEFARAVLGAGGELVTGGRIPAAAIEAVIGVSEGTASAEVSA